MKSSLALSSLFVSLTTANVAYATDDCDDVLMYSGRNITQSLNAAQRKDFDYFFNCTSEGKQRSGNLDIVYKAFSLGLGGSEYQEQRACTEKARAVDERTMSDYFQSTVVETSITAWVSCKALSAGKYKINLSDNNATASISISNPSPEAVTFWLRPSVYNKGLFVSDIDSCFVTPPSAKTQVIEGQYEVVIQPASQTNLSCNRTVVEEDRSGFLIRYNPAINVSVTSEMTPVQAFPFAERVLNPQTINSLATMQGEIADLKSRISKLNSRIDGIRLLAKDAGRGEFACGHEFADKPDSLVVMYGSKDGTGCGVPNRNYMKELSISVPPDSSQ